MEQITIGQISIFLTFLISFIGSVTYLSNTIKKQINKLFMPIRENIKDVDKSQCKNFLVRFLKDVENGVKVNEVEKERAYECYEHYTKDLDGNSYIHDWWDKLMKGSK